LRKNKGGKKKGTRKRGECSKESNTREKKGHSKRKNPKHEKLRIKKKAIVGFSCEHNIQPALVYSYISKGKNTSEEKKKKGEKVSDVASSTGTLFTIAGNLGDGRRLKPGGR